ncbi:hypothetical protein WISP_94199 [Willisornis vidua]|uniref:Uncharacterized protein n=1 Tax=Willisornis vidua TaxID=1566151 RepID=A0ABQ9D5Z0_9PASS|nr:hypothetical protein WISP_94199 [Willisornis vidua]
MERLGLCQVVDEEQVKTLQVVATTEKCCAEGKELLRKSSRTPQAGIVLGLNGWLTSLSAMSMPAFKLLTDVAEPPLWSGCIFRNENRKSGQDCTVSKGDNINGTTTRQNKFLKSGRELKMETVAYYVIDCLLKERLKMHGIIKMGMVLDMHHNHTSERDMRLKQMEQHWNEKARSQIPSMQSIVLHHVA